MVQPWFTEAKLGIFLHWGIYAVNGITESWSFFNEEISYADYRKQLDSFTASNYDPQAWAELFARVGARYAVLTTKHHDGVALWDTAVSDLSVAQKSPAARDLIGPFCEALREKGLRVGLYFSHLDWSHPEYAPVPIGERTKKTWQEQIWEGGPANPHWQNFLEFERAQFAELATRYQPDLFWCDGDWTPKHEWWEFEKTATTLRKMLPAVMLNSRFGTFGDYSTPEQGQPIAQPKGAWEFCVTLNDSWGYQGHDTNHKSVPQLVRMFAEVIGMGGNMLLGIGPMADGTIPSEQVERLEALGDWIHRHEEAIYPTEAGLPSGHCYGATTLTKDRETLYVFLFDRPWDEFAVKGIRNDVKRVSVVGSEGEELPFRKVGGAPWVNIPGILWITVPESVLDRNATVLKIELDGPLDLWSGAGHAIETN